MPLAAKYAYKLIRGSKIKTHSVLMDLVSAMLSFVLTFIPGILTKVKLRKIKKGMHPKVFKAKKIEISNMSTLFGKVYKSYL